MAYYKDDGDSHSVEDRTTKKVRFKGGIDEASVDMVVDPDLISAPSWKDKLLDGDPNHSMMDRNVSSFGRDSASDGDFDLLAGDVQTSIVNGVPAISFSVGVKEIFLKEMELTVVIKLLGQSIGYNTLHNRITSLWKPISPSHLMGPWIIFGNYLTVQPWTKDFSPMQPYPSVVFAWIQLLGLLGFLFRWQIVEAIRGLIEKFVKLEFQTDNRTRVRFARLAQIWARQGFMPVVVADRTLESPSEVVTIGSNVATGGAVEETGPKFNP
ncbi:hypothetical protein Golob_006330 [Gossypium lobatum]|uniref:DUF4283 domain-containing protein n=1 Tax=Gossypium lobatum TaxID=34289 RepID=A0A7J8MVY6_9ROSI|nr:hypothetical protein [Gossypium lobatum]